MARSHFIGIDHREDEESHSGMVALNLSGFMMTFLVVSKNYDTWTHSPDPDTWPVKNPVTKTEIP
jgi:hypothetical protein